MKGLVVDDPWIGYFLDGSKTWEMRSQPTTHRGWVALIRKGTGTVVCAGRLVAVGEPLDEAGMIAAIPKHRIPEATIRSGSVARWTVPWVFEDVTPLATPVPYDHPSGAVTWVNLDDATSVEISRQVSDVRQGRASPVAEPAVVALPPSAPRRATEAPMPPLSVEPDRIPANGETVIGRSRLTDGNINNNHFYLKAFVDRFPADALGGGNRHDAGVPVHVDWGGGAPVSTDIAGDKKIFRSRGWVKAFFERSGAKQGDHVVITRTGPRSYRVRVES
jgi:hypothetical protein